MRGIHSATRGGLVALGLAAVLGAAGIFGPARAQSESTGTGGTAPTVLQDYVFATAVRNRDAVTIHLEEGGVVAGVISRHDRDALMVEGKGGVRLVYKQAIATIDLPASYSLLPRR